MFFVLPVCVKDPSGRDTVPLANSLLVAANVLVFFLNAYLGWPLAGVGRGTSLFTVLAYGFTHAGALLPKDQP